MRIYIKKIEWEREKGARALLDFLATALDGGENVLPELFLKKETLTGWQSVKLRSWYSFSSKCKIAIVNTVESSLENAIEFIVPLTNWISNG